jgi:dihydrofolate synthase/folylpolyglutamate synthase
MSYAIALARLTELGHELGSHRKFDLEHMRVLARALGNPERRFASVLIAGTNGKGSTAATLAAILQAAEYRTGLYTSPHMVHVNERIRLDGVAISDAEFGEMFRRVEEAAAQLVSTGELPHAPSFFEMLTAMAFEYFASVGTEIAVLEVGMGGRLDATNIVEPCVSVIGDIALDHQKFLGDTIGLIAREKAGIIRPNGVVVTLPQHPEANDVIGNTILERNARGVSAVPYVPPVSPHAEVTTGAGLRNRYRLAVLDREITVDSPLIGRHQLRNIALAIAAAVELKSCGLPVSAEDIECGIRQTRWPGRLQFIAGKSGVPDVLLDSAHNPAGTWALRSALSTYFAERPLVMIFAAMRDKAIAEMAEILFPLAERVIATRIAADNPRAAEPEEIRSASARMTLQIETAPALTAALDRARCTLPQNGLIVVTGSIYIVGEALSLLGVAP